MSSIPAGLSSADTAASEADKLPQTDDRVALRDYQEEAVSAIHEELGRSDRCQLRAACGMGKTIIAQEAIARHYDGDRCDTGVYVVVTSSIQLTRQTRGDFEGDGLVEDMEAFSVHDGSTDLERGRKSRGATKPGAAEEADVDAIREYLEHPGRGPKVVFSTYDSIHKVARAQRLVGDSATADMVVLDEAHRLGGHFPGTQSKRSSRDDAAPDPADEDRLPRLPRVLFNEGDGSLQASSRVFLSATPRSESEAACMAPRLVMDKSQILRMYETEDSGGKVKSFGMYHTNTEVFGKTVRSWGLGYAVSKGALVPMGLSSPTLLISNSSGGFTGRSTQVLPSGVVPEGPSDGTMTTSSWGTAASALESLATGEGHNALAFSRSISDAEGVASRWRDVAYGLAGDDAPSLDEARGILERGGEGARRERQARLVLLAEHGSVVAASSKSARQERERAAAHFDDHEIGDKGCSCRRPGGWCACARVVSNVDLFGEGVSINSVDTVIMGNPDKTSDGALTQAIGRAMRKWDSGGKSKGRVVVPSIQAETPSGTRTVDAQNTVFALYGASRLMRDSIGSSMEGRAMQPDESRATVATPSGRIEVEEAISRALPSMDQAAIVHRCWSSADRAARSHYKQQNPRSSWADMNKEEQHDHVVDYARAFSAESPELEVISQIRPDMHQVDEADRAMRLLEFKAKGNDRKSLSRTDAAVAKGMGWLDRNGLPAGKPLRSSLQRITKELGSRRVMRLVDGLRDRD